MNVINDCIINLFKMYKDEDIILLESEVHTLVLCGGRHYDPYPKNVIMAITMNWKNYEWYFTNKWNINNKKQIHGYVMHFTCLNDYDQIDYYVEKIYRGDKRYSKMKEEIIKKEENRFGEFICRLFHISETELELKLQERLIEMI